MKKKDLWVLSTILAIPLIVGFILALIFNFRLEKSEWITLVTSCVSTFAAIYLGYMVFFQAENHKKRQEEENALYQEQAEKNRKQDLMLRANPYAIFNKIECIRYAQSSVFLPKENTYNRLTNINYEDFHLFYEHVYMDLNFTIPQGNVLEHVYIKTVDIRCYKGEFARGKFEEIANYSLKNYSTDKNISNIKVNSVGGVDALLSLLFDTNDMDNNKNDIKKLLDDREIKWAITICYNLSNSFNVQISYKTHINFCLTEGHTDEYGDISYALIQPIITTIQTCNIKIKEKANELNA